MVKNIKISQKNIEETWYWYVTDIYLGLREEHYYQVKIVSSYEDDGDDETIYFYWDENDREGTAYAKDLFLTKSDAKKEWETRFSKQKENIKSQLNSYRDLILMILGKTKTRFYETKDLIELCVLERLEELEIYEALQDEIKEKQKDLGDILKDILVLDQDFHGISEGMTENERKILFEQVYKDPIDKLKEEESEVREEIESLSKELERKLLKAAFDENKQNEA